jgi:opacity protein-like surface antigen
MEKVASALAVLALLPSAMLWAQASQTPAPQTNTNYELPYRYRAAIEPRPVEGTRYVAASGGLSVVHGTENAAVDLNPLVPGLGKFRFRDDWDNKLAVSIKAGQVFPITDPLSTDEVKFSAVAEGEFSFNQSRATGSVDAGLPLGSSVRGEIENDNFIFMANGIGRLEYKFLRPYAGLGLGFTLTHTSTRIDVVSLPGNATFQGDDFDICFTGQGLAGLELSISSQWSVFGEYKHQVIVDPKSEEASYEFKSDYFHQGIISGGLKYYF